MTPELVATAKLSLDAIACTLERLEDRLIDAEIHRRDCDHDFRVAREALLKAVLAESLATDALEHARLGSHG